MADGHRHGSAPVVFLDESHLIDSGHHRRFRHIAFVHGSSPAAVAAHSTGMAVGLGSSEEN
jgi:hypothetical protein